ncbi:MAG: hypothetical protein ABIJ61_06355, partial [bacterium]
DVHVIGNGQGFQGLVWYRYLKANKHPTLCGAAGIGRYFGIRQAFSSSAGFGLLGGIGYEIWPHFHLLTYLSLGIQRHGFLHYHVNVIFLAVAF